MNAIEFQRGEAAVKIKAKVYFNPGQVDEMQLKDKNVVIIDVLRASTTVAMALQNGAKEIIPVNSVESVVKISGNLFGDVTLRAGERNSKMIEGFNLGNSPLEYTSDVVKGKSIIFMTSNGSAAMVKGRHAHTLVVAAFVNLSTVVKFLAGLRSDISIICAGDENNFCLEDTVCAGRIINTLVKGTDLDIDLDDAGTAACALDKAFGKNILKMLKTSEHGKFLTDIGFAQDLKTCAAIDSIDVLPMLSGNVIKAKKNSVEGH